MEVMIMTITIFFFFFFFFAADLLVLKLVNIPCWICGASIDLIFAAVVCVSSNR